MNIFYLHRDPVKAATVQYNKHVVKMILESAQMLCTAHHCYGSTEQKANVPYRQAHLNHPSTVWARRSVKTYQWLYDHMIALGEEYTKRYGKEHLAIHKCKDFLATPPKYIQGSDWCQPPQCMPDQYKVDGDSVSAYWNYYENEKHTVRNSNEKLISRECLV
jgi:hypothetical protein